MKRLLSLVITLAVVLTGQVWGSQPSAETDSWTSAEEHVQYAAREKLSGYEAFRTECEKTVEQVKAALHTYVSTVITVAKAVGKAVLTIVTSVVRLVARFAFAIVLIVARWLLSLFLPV
jgi:predicted GTPase